MKQKKKEKFQERVDQIISEKKQKEQLRLAQMRALPPEIRKKIEKTNMMREKAQREENLGKKEIALKRYEYILNTYTSISNDIVDLSTDISEIQKKISEMFHQQ